MTGSAQASAMTIVPANEASWEDLQAVLGTRGVAATCQCQRYKLEPRESFSSFPAEERAFRLRTQTDCGRPGSDTTSGLVAYLDGEPVGWCAVEPRTAYPGLVRVYRVPWAGRAEDKSDDSVWAVTCVFTRAGFRRRGISYALVRAAVDFARERGARALEGYPMLTEPGRDVTWGELHVGTRSIFEAAGFAEVSHPTPRRVVMRIDFGATDDEGMRSVRSREKPGVLGSNVARTASQVDTAAVGPPEVQYAKSGDVNIAYQVRGEGPFDLVLAPAFVTHVAFESSIPSFARFLDHLASFSRLIWFDKRGTGMSDRVSGAPTLEMRMDDVRAVMDAVGSRRAAFYGVSEGAAMCILFAATYPERMAALVVRSAYPRRMWAPDYPWGRTQDEYEREVERDLRLFGPRDRAADAMRTLGHLDDQEVRSFVDLVRFGSSPGSLEALHLMNREIDVRHVLPAVRVPTLILHGSEDKIVPLEVARYMASRIPTARVVEVPEAGHLALSDPRGTIGAEIERFVKEVWEAGGWQQDEPDRVLATILFTDIVGSTARAVELGDRAWRELLERHHALIRRELVRFRGAELDIAGDGFFARFDGPARAIRCACAITDSMRELGLEIRAGLHTGECEVIDGKVGGIAVHIGARVAKEAQPGEVLVSSTVKDLVAGSGLRFRERGSAQLKGVGEDWRLYAVERAE